MILGLTGPMGSGKGEIINILTQKGYKHITLSSLLKEEARRQGVSEGRDQLGKIGNMMRVTEGAGVLGKRALDLITASEHTNWIVDGVRNPAEIEALREDKSTHIVGLEADRNLLIERIIKRARPGDPTTEVDIITKLEREWGVGEPEEGQQVRKCMEMVDSIIENNDTLEDLGLTLAKFLEKMAADRTPVMPLKTIKYARPTKDEYYLDLARSVCRRGTCTKVEIGSVIIKEDQVVATGYCGAPRGTKSSQEHGFCLRKKLGIPSGQRYEMCRSVHAEQNAIINAARAGASLLGGDIYIYGQVQSSGDTKTPIDAFPCFICKKMLINCGLKRVICSLKDGSHKIFHVEEWVKAWRENDIIDDKYQYGAGIDAKTEL